MPTYEYVCRACEHEFEEFQSMSAKPLKKCPKCGKLQLERLIGTGERALASFPVPLFTARDVSRQRGASRGGGRPVRRGR